MTKAVAIPNAFAEYNAQLKLGSEGVSEIGVCRVRIGSTRGAATGTVVVRPARGIGEGPARRLGGGALVKARAVRWRLNRTTGTLKATVEIPSYNEHGKKQKGELSLKDTRGPLGPISEWAVSPWRRHDQTASTSFDHSPGWFIRVYGFSARVGIHGIFMHSICDG